MPVEIQVMENAVFYDGYLMDNIVDAGLDDGILRHSNSLYAVRLDDKAIDAIGPDLTLKVTLHARCDNYDRMGNIRLAFVPKGSATYAEDNVERIEIARFITPFMNMNKIPDKAGYEWYVPEVAYVLRDPSVRAEYDIWLETYLFGIPYDAQAKIRGCKNRNDVYGVDVTLCSNEDSDGAVGEAATYHTVTPVYITRPEYMGNVNLNNYNPEACDEVGVTARTFDFTTGEDYSDSRLTLILTNHGAGENGEEYVRRLHHVFVDGELLLSYTPGGESCEPYRHLNTQANGIYGTRPDPENEAEWWDWNNWCPGAAVPVRNIPLGALPKGTHSVRIYVPDAEFHGNDGDFRPSLYVQGVSRGTLSIAGVNELPAETLSGASFTRAGDEVRFSACNDIREVRVYADGGALLRGCYHPGGSVSLAGISKGTVVLVVVLDADGRYATFKTAV